MVDTIENPKNIEASEQIDILSSSHKIAIIGDVIGGLINKIKEKSLEPSFINLLFNSDRKGEYQVEIVLTMDNYCGKAFSIKDKTPIFFSSKGINSSEVNGDIVVETNEIHQLDEKTRICITSSIILELINKLAEKVKDLSFVEALLNVGKQSEYFDVNITLKLVNGFFESYSVGVFRWFGLARIRRFKRSIDSLEAQDFSSAVVDLTEDEVSKLADGLAVENDDLLEEDQ